MEEDVSRGERIAARSCTLSSNPRGVPHDVLFRCITRGDWGCVGAYRRFQLPKEVESRMVRGKVWKGGSFLNSILELLAIVATAYAIVVVGGG